MTEFADKLRLLKGTPFVHQGRSKHGLDCIGFAAFAWDFPLNEIPAYPRDPINGELENAMLGLFGPAALTKPIAANMLREGDLVAMQYKGPIRHVGIVLNHLTIPGELSLIHTDIMIGQVTEHRLDFKWLRRIEKVWRLESV